MKKHRLVFITIIVAAMLFPFSSAFAVEMLIGPTGVIQFNPEKSLNGYVLFSAAGNQNSYLIDQEGYVVHEWTNLGSGPGLHDRLLPNGNLLRGFRPTTDYDGNPVGSGVNIGGSSGGVQEFDWDGNLIWEYINKTNESVQHHTFYRMPNGNTLILLWEKISCADAVAEGRDPALCVEADGLWPDAIEEVDHTLLPGRPNVVWEWHVMDHVVQDFDNTKPNYGNPSLNTDKLDLNFYYPVPWGYKDWNHGNTVEYQESTDEVIFNSRNWGEFYVIDHETGNIKFRWGNPFAARHGQGPSFNENGDEELFGPHCAVFIEDSDNILVFDNGWVRPEGNNSRSVEVQRDIEINLTNTPTIYPGGKLEGDPAAPIVWQYASQDPNGFYTTFQGGTGRLPNGNTFVTSTDGGHLFEIAREWGVVNPNTGAEGWINSVVWEFIVPPRDADGNAVCINNDRVGATIHRAHLLPRDYAAFEGKDLSRKYHIAAGCPEFWKLWGEDIGVAPEEEYVAPTGWGTSGLSRGEGGSGSAGGGSGGSGY